MTEFEKWHNMIDAYEKILHPDLFLPIKQQLSKVYEEAKNEAFKAAKISDEAREIDKELQQLKESVKQVYNSSTLTSFQLKCFYKFLIKKLK